jgi:hypothetical protein
MRAWFRCRVGRPRPTAPSRAATSEISPARECWDRAKKRVESALADGTAFFPTVSPGRVDLRDSEQREGTGRAGHPSLHSIAFTGRKASASPLEVKDIQNHVRTLIHEHHVSADDHVSATRRRRRQAVLHFFRTRQHPLPQAGGQSSPYPQLTFEPRRQLIALRQSRWKVIVMIVVVVPPAHIVAVVVAVIVAVSVIVAVMIVAMPVRTSDSRERQTEHEYESATPAHHAPFLFHGVPFELSFLGRIEPKWPRRGAQITNAPDPTSALPCRNRIANSPRERLPAPLMLYTPFANVLLLRTLQGENRNSETGVHQVSASQRAKKVPD